MDAADSIFGKIAFGPGSSWSPESCCFLSAPYGSPLSIGLALLTHFIVVLRLSLLDFFYSFFLMSFSMRNWPRFFFFSCAECWFSPFPWWMFPLD